VEINEPDKKVYNDKEIWSTGIVREESMKRITHTVIFAELDERGAL